MEVSLSASRSNSGGVDGCLNTHAVSIATKYDLFAVLQLISTVTIWVWL